MTFPGTWWHRCIPAASAVAGLLLRLMGNELAPVLSSPQEEKVSSIFFPFTVNLFVTPGKPWADTIDCSYRKEHTAKDLVGLKDYLAAGTIVSVVEEKVSVWQGLMKRAGRENSCWGGAAVALHSL